MSRRLPIWCDMNSSLDPSDWSDLRSLGHRMMDDMFDHLESLRDGPVWRPMPADVRADFHQPLPRDPASAEAVYARSDGWSCPM